MSVPYKIAFIGWNSFQFLYVKNLLEQIPNSKFFVLKRVDGNEELFTHNIIGNLNDRVVFISTDEIAEVDKKYDVIIAQTAFYGIEKIKNAKLVFLQYGYAKEPYNFGKWRAISDLTLVYGEYAKERVEKYTPAVCVGNPRFDELYNNDFYSDCKKRYSKYVEKDKKTILYVPTWGELSSFDLYIDAILALGKEYNILIKLHHNTEMLETNRLKKLEKYDIHYFGKDDDILKLITVSDIVISDYSGAIFDAFYCKKPLVLLNIDMNTLLNSKKIDLDSIEFAKRDILGTTATTTDKLEYKIKEALQLELTNKQIELRTRLFLETNNSCDNIVNSISDLMNKKYNKSREQLVYEKEIIKEYGSFKRVFKEYAKNIYLYALYIMRKV